MIYNRILEESHRLESQIRFAQSEIKKLPEGKLIKKTNGIRVTDTHLLIFPSKKGNSQNNSHTRNTYHFD